MELDHGVFRTVLPGGLRVITQRMSGARSAAVGLWVGIGSRDEEPALAGAAHYLEHLLFKATTRRTAEQIAQEVDAVGGEFNAFTSKEHTCFYAHVVDTDLPLAMDLVCDVVFEALCTDADMEIERSVVLDEIAMRDDDPEDRLHELFAEALMGDHPLALPVLGSEQSIRDLEASALRGFYRERYQLPAMVLAVAGNVAHDEVLRLAHKALSSRLGGPEQPDPPRAGRAVFPPSRRLALDYDDTEQAHVVLGFGGLDRHDGRRFALSVLSSVLGGGMSSRLFQEIRERRGLAYQVYASMMCYADTGHLSAYAGCHPDRLGEVCGVLRDVVADVAARGLTEEEIARAKGQLRGGLILGLEDTASMMSRIGKNELNYGRYYSLDETVARIEAVTVADVADLAAELLRDVHAAAVVGPYARTGDLPAELREVMA